VTSSSSGLELKVQTASCGANQAQPFFQVINHGTTAVPLSALKIRFWADDTSGSAIQAQINTGGCVSLAGNPSCVHQVQGVTAAVASFSPACGPSPTQQANWEVTISVSDGSTLPAGATWSNLQSQVHRADFNNFKPGTVDWYSGCLPPSPNYVDTTTYALYNAGTLVRDSSGVPPSCRAPTGTQTISGEVPPAVKTAPLVGPLAGTTHLTLNIGLPLQTNGAPGSGMPPLDTFIQQVSNPQSPPGVARKYLTPTSFAAAYGSKAADYTTLKNFATANGLTIARTFTARNLLAVTGTAAAISKAFFVTLNVYKRPDGTMFFAPANDPSVNLAPALLHVSGMDSFSVPIAAGGTSPTSCTQNTVGTQREFFGPDFRNAYLPGCATTALEGQGQTVALLEFDSYVQADVLNYAQGLAPVGTGVPLDAPGLPATLTNVTQELVPSSTQLSFDTVTFTPSFGLAEVGLDMQMVLAMAPQANLIVYEYNGFTLDLILSQMADDNRAQTISTSWSWFPGAPDPIIQAVFQQYAAQGQTFFYASGDLGAYIPTNPYDGVTPSPQPTLLEPALESSLMTVVGGTVLSTTGSNGTLGNYATETTWNNIGPNEQGAGRPGNSVSGGGFVTGTGPIGTLPIPTYQIGVNPTNAEVNANPQNARMIPDVSWIADGLASFCGVGNGGCDFAGDTSICEGGTSAAAPLWAAYTALINQAAGSRGPIGFANPTLYFLAASPASYALNYHDINDGTNNNYFDDGALVQGTAPLNGVTGAPAPGTSEAPGLYHAFNGFDLATGLGTPTCNLISTLPPQSCSVGTSVSALITGNNVTAYMPNGSWDEATTGISVVALEGTGPTAQVSTGTGIVNTCAGNSVTGKVVCTANFPDANGTNVYVLNGTTITNSLTSAGADPAQQFSGGTCTTCNVVIDPLHNQGFLSVSTATGAAFQPLNLATNPPTLGATPFQTGQPESSEDLVVDAVRGLVLSPNEANDYQLVNTTTGQTFNFSPGSGDGEFDSAAEDCTTGIALATGEFGTTGTLFLTDLSQSTFTVNSGTPNTWTAPNSFQAVPEFAGFAFGVSGISVDSSGSHLGVVAGEFGILSGITVPGGDQFGLIQLPASSVHGVAPTLVDWVQASIPPTPDALPWEMGHDPHTLTVYTSPSNHRQYAVFEDDAFGTGQRTFLAVVDLQALKLLPRVVAPGQTDPHVVASPLTTCTGAGPNPAGCIVRFVATP
jgi:hypothetical protein